MSVEARNGHLGELYSHLAKSLTFIASLPASQNINIYLLQPIFIEQRCYDRHLAWLEIQQKDA